MLPPAQLALDHSFRLGVDCYVWEAPSSNPWFLSAVLFWRCRLAGAISFARRPFAPSKKLPRPRRTTAAAVICAIAPIAKGPSRNHRRHQRRPAAAVAANSIGCRLLPLKNLKLTRRSWGSFRRRLFRRPVPACATNPTSRSPFHLLRFTSSNASGCVNGSVVARRLCLPANSVCFQTHSRPLR